MMFLMSYALFRHDKHTPCPHTEPRRDFLDKYIWFNRLNMFANIKRCVISETTASL